MCTLCRLGGRRRFSAQCVFAPYPAPLLPPFDICAKCHAAQCRRAVVAVALRSVRIALCMLSLLWCTCCTVYALYMCALNKCRVGHLELADWQLSKVSTRYICASQIAHCEQYKVYRLALRNKVSMRNRSRSKLAKCIGYKAQNSLSAVVQGGWHSLYRESDRPPNDVLHYDL